MRLPLISCLSAVLFYSALPASAQEVAHTATPTVIKTETKVVLVDTVVTDKKGNYVADLSQKSFKIYEDNKEQPITSFTYEADPASPSKDQKHYLVLFFDNASVSAGDQISARTAAARFVDSNTGPNKYIAVVNFSGSLKITQNFTNDPDRLKAVIAGAKSASVSTADDTPTIGAGGQVKLSETAAFGVRSVLLGLRSLAKNLSDVPGRKTLIMLTAGFAMNEEVRSELTATIAACNKANVAVYPIDVRGLVTNVPGRPIMREEPQPMARLVAPAPRLSAFVRYFYSPDQARGGGGGGVAGGGTAGGGGAAGASAGAAGASAGARGGASSPGGSTGATSPGGSIGGGARGGATGINNGPGTVNRTPGGVNNPGNNPNGGRGFGGGSPDPSMMNRNPLNQPRTIMPNINPSSDDNLNALYMLADGTGGFVIKNTNDLLGGLEKIAKEQNQYYIIGFSPSESAEGSCHSLRVKLDKGGNTVRSRSGYCNTHQIDVLAGKPAETELESIAAGVSPGTLVSPLQIPFFFSAPNVARVNVIMEIPTKGIKFEKVKGKMHAEVNLLGIAYRPDGSVGARFSDTIKLDYDSKGQAEEFSKTPYHYEGQFDVATGRYTFKVVFSTGRESFGKLERPLNIDAFDGKQFAVSAVAIGTELRATNSAENTLDSALVEDRVPMVAIGRQLIPTAKYSFRPTETTYMYLEMYEPGLTEEKPPAVEVVVRILDRQSGAEKLNSGNVALQQFVRAGNPLVPVILKLPINTLTAGAYKVEVTGLDARNMWQLRSIDFEIE